MRRIHSHAEDLAFGTLLVEKTQVLVLRADSEMDGFLATQDDEIQALYLRRKARRKGFGKTLVDHAKSQRNQLFLWVFQANSAAIRFYEREGFREIDRTDGSGNDEGLPDIRMMWQRDLRYG